MSKLSQDDLLSFFQIGGIHGLPYVSWNDSGSEEVGDWGGYCTHGSNLFPTWHRPYVSTYEVRSRIFISTICTHASYSNFSSAMPSTSPRPTRSTATPGTRPRRRCARRTGIGRRRLCRPRRSARWSRSRLCAPTARAFRSPTPSSATTSTPSTRASRPRTINGRSRFVTPDRRPGPTRGRTCPRWRGESEFCVGKVGPF